MTEEELIALYRRYDGPLKSFGNKLLSDRERVDEIVSSAWVKVIKGEIVDTGFFFRNMCSFVKWRILDWKKHIGRKYMQYEHVQETVINPVKDNHLIDKVMQAAKYLPPKRKKIFEMRYVLGFDPIEIARLLGVTVDTVNVQCHRSIQFLRRTITSGNY